MKKDLTVCYFGIYNKEYPRNKNTIDGLRANGIKVIEVSDRTPGPKKFFKLFKKYWRIKKHFDVMIVGFPGQIIVPFAKLITRKPVLFDLFVSYYDSIILERKNYKVNSIYAKWYYFLDRFSCYLADRVLMDTQEHAKYISELLKISKNKIITLYIGVDSQIFKPSINVKKDKEKFIISFHGYIQILNGMDLVIDAMRQLKDENIELWIIGGGSEYGNIKSLTKKLKLKNVIFFPLMKPKELVEKVSQADIGIGFFSNSKKINRVIANKVYELIAMKVPVLTGESMAMKELFKHKKHVYYCQRGNIDSIVNAIRELKKKKDLRDKLTDNSYTYTKKYLKPEVLCVKLVKLLYSL